MPRAYLQVNPNDNVLIALRELRKGHKVIFNDHDFVLQDTIPAKHKFAMNEIAKGQEVIMYDVVVGRSSAKIPRGGRITVENTTHAVDVIGCRSKSYSWNKPDISKYVGKTFQGYHRQDGRVGTMNYWLVIPLVFCENRNVEVIKEALLEKLGYGILSKIIDIGRLVDIYESGGGEGQILSSSLTATDKEKLKARTFQNVDGIKFLNHNGGCGGTREDSDALCNLLAGYIVNPNVAGATVLSLGCQNAQVSILQESIKKISPCFAKPLKILEQQKSESEAEFIENAIKQTFVGLMDANTCVRKPADLKHLTLGLECGGSDGFSGISANPSLGYASDLLVALGGTAILSEFPELNGVEQELINRCVTDNLADKFADLMKAYAERAEAVGSGFKNNPSPGNIKDGLITDAMKSAGAAKKGGSSPICGVLDYTEQVNGKGLNLLCTPGNDVESTTALAGSGANLIVFTTGLGTPTGNPISPVIKVSSNNELNEKMGDIIDFNAGAIISGEEDIQENGEHLLDYIIQVASGEVLPHAVRLGQDDFIPWKRGVSL